MKKSRYLVSLVLNLLIVLCDGWALAVGAFGFAGMNAMGVGLFKFFTEDSNLLLLVASLIMIVADLLALTKKQPLGRFPVLFKFVATVLVTTTFLVVACFLLPTSFAQNGWGMWSWPHMCFVHVVCPLLALVSFAFFETEPLFKKCYILALYPLIFVLVYGIAMATLCSLPATGIQDPYGFLNVTAHEWWFIAVAWLLIIGGTYLAAFLLLLLRGLTRSEKPASSESKKADDSSSKDVDVIEDSEDDEEAEEAKEEKDEAEAQKANPTGYMDRPRVYHVAKQPSGQWQVKLAAGQKAIKLFPTQEEAIAYAKGLVKTQGGSIRVHSLKGKMRKD
jgi:hypothetical protein